MDVSLAALQGFAVIAIVTAVGVIVGRRRVLGVEANAVLNRTAFHIGVPALVLIGLADAEPSQVFSLTLLALAVAALTTYGISCLVSTAMRRPRAEATIAAMLASYSNAGYLGIPLSSYVFGSTTAASSLIVFQVLVLVPISMAVLDSQSSQHASAARRVAGLVTNPIIASSAIGLLLSVTGSVLPQVIRDSLELLAALAVPTVLLAYGISLSTRAGGHGASRGDLVVAVLLKTVLMPGLAYGVARWGLGVHPHQLMIVTVLAALPAAQNINTYAVLYRCGEDTARDATILSTLVSVPVILTIISLTGS